MIEYIRSRMRASAQVKLDAAENDELIGTLTKAIDLSIDCFKKGNQMLICGNGGSAADAQHLAAELTGRFYKDRRPLPAYALHSNSSFLTAVANDYDYNEVFSRATESLGRRGDVLLALSTSGNSENVIRALQKAMVLGMRTIGFTGRQGGRMVDVCEYVIKVPSDDVARIQEGHITVGHILCEAIENGVF